MIGVPRISASCTSDAQGIGATREQITIPAGAKAVLICTDENTAGNLPIYVGPTNDDNEGVVIGSGSGDRNAIYLELATDGVQLWANNNSSPTADSTLNFTWFY